MTVLCSVSLLLFGLLVATAQSQIENETSLAKNVEAKLNAIGPGLLAISEGTNAVKGTMETFDPLIDYACPQKLLNVGVPQRLY